jgi:hypothetical protein
MGQKRTNGLRPKRDFVRYCPKADKRKRGWVVRYVPLADMDGYTIVPQIGANGILRNICSGKQIVESHR